MVRWKPGQKPTYRRNLREDSDQLCPMQLRDQPSKGTDGYSNKVKVTGDFCQEPQIRAYLKLKTEWEERSLGRWLQVTLSKSFITVGKRSGRVIDKKMWGKRSFLRIEKWNLICMFMRLSQNKATNEQCKTKLLQDLSLSKRRDILQCLVGRIAETVRNEVEYIYVYMDADTGGQVVNSGGA